MSRLWDRDEVIDFGPGPDGSTERTEDYRFGMVNSEVIEGSVDWEFPGDN